MLLMSPTVLCAACAFFLYRSRLEPAPPATNELAVGTDSDEPGNDRPGPGRACLWLLLSACGSVLLLATTNQMSMDIAVVPLLWILPLCIYLTTFILTFDHERWYVGSLFVALLPLVLLNAVRLLYRGVALGIVEQVLGYSLTLFVCCMCCHGELARSRPQARYLTFFFLIVATGGAVGGVLVAIVAPAIFAGFYEYHLGLIGCYALISFVFGRLLIAKRDPPIKGGLIGGLAGFCWLIGLGTIAYGTVLLLRPDTWLEDASSHARATFVVWQASMRIYVSCAVLALLAALEIWRRVSRASLRE